MEPLLSMIMFRGRKQYLPVTIKPGAMNYLRFEITSYVPLPNFEIFRFANETVYLGKVMTNKDDSILLRLSHIGYAKSDSYFVEIFESILPSTEFFDKGIRVKVNLSPGLVEHPDIKSSYDKFSLRGPSAYTFRIANYFIQDAAGSPSRAQAAFKEKEGPQVPVFKKFTPPSIKSAEPSFLKPGIVQDDELAKCKEELRKKDADVLKMRNELEQVRQALSLIARESTAKDVQIISLRKQLKEMDEKNVICNPKEYIKIPPSGYVSDSDILESIRKQLKLFPEAKSKDPYISMGLPAQASRAELRARWLRGISLIWHPDKYPNCTEEHKVFVEEQYKKYVEAYGKLT